MSQQDKLPDIGNLIAGRFRILDQLGQGGFGTVYRARQENIGREVALKFLTPDVAQNPDNIERFRREAFHVSQLRHPNTITLYDYGQSDSGLIYMVMEYVDGDSLAEIIQAQNGLPFERVKKVYEQVLQSLAEAHRTGLVHRDLKPENIFLCEMFGQSDYVKVLDFGVAKMTLPSEQSAGDTSLTKAGHIFGTPMYMAPEQATDAPITPATDVYALGLLLFETSTGNPPVNGRSRMEVINKQIQEDVPKLTAALKSSPIGELIRKACHKDPGERYENASELLEAFQDACRQLERDEIENSLPEDDELEPTEQMTITTDIIEKATGHREPESPPEPPPIPPESVSDREAVKRGELPLFGRGDLIDEVMNRIELDLDEGSTSIVLLEGQEGVGKTRVVETLEKKFQSKDFRTGLGNFRRNSLPMEALREALVDSLSLKHATRETIEGRIETDLIDKTDFSDDEIEFLSEFLSRTGAGGLQVSDASPEAGAVFALFERLFLNMVQNEPVAVFLEDVHFADSTTFRFLEYMAVTLQTKDIPLVFVLTLHGENRPEYATVQENLRAINSNSGGALVRFPVKPLKGQALDDFLDAVLPMSAGLKERVGWLSQGLPLHAIQIVEYLKNEDELVKNDERWELKEGTPREIDLPPDMLEFMELRLEQAIEQHPEHIRVRPVLEWLSVLGMRTPIALLEDVLIDATEVNRGEISEALERLSKQGLLERTTHKQLQCVEFKNNLIREALLKNLSDRWDSTDYHSTAAAAKKQFYRERERDIPYVEIADHWRLAGNRDKYREAIARAAEVSKQQFDLRGARDRFEELIDVLEEGGNRGQDWIDAHLQLADISRRFGKFGQSEQYYRRALTTHETDDPVAEARIQRGLGELLFVEGRHSEAAHHYREALQLSRDTGDDFGVVEALLGLSKVHLMQGDTQQTQKSRQNLESVLSKLPDGELKGRVLMHFAKIAKRDGRLTDRLERLEEAREQLRDSDSNQALSDALIALGSALLDPGIDSPDRLSRAKDVLDEALQLKRRIGDRFGVAEAYRHLGQLQYENGEYETAEKLLKQGLNLHRALNTPFKIGASYNDLGIVKMLTFDLQAAEKFFDKSLEQLEKVGDEVAKSHTIINKAITLMNRRRMGEAEELLEQAQHIKEVHKTSWALFDLRNHLAIIDMWNGRFDKAKQRLKNTLLEVDEHGTVEDKAVAQSLLGLLYTFENNPQPAALELGRARGDADDLGIRRTKQFCNANAAFYAKLTGSQNKLKELIGKLGSDIHYQELHRQIWLELLERMADRAAVGHPDDFGQQLHETVEYLQETLR